MSICINKQNQYSFRLFKSMLELLTLAIKTLKYKALQLTDENFIL